MEGAQTAEFALRLNKTQSLFRTCNNCSAQIGFLKRFQKGTLDGLIASDDGLAFDHILPAIKIGDEAASLTDHDDTGANIPW